MHNCDWSVLSVLGHRSQANDMLKQPTTLKNYWISGVSDIGNKIGTRVAATSRVQARYFALQRGWSAVQVEELVDREPVARKTITLKGKK